MRGAGQRCVLFCGDGANDVGALKQARTHAISPPIVLVCGAAYPSVYSNGRVQTHVEISLPTCLLKRKTPDSYLYLSLCSAVGCGRGAAHGVRGRQRTGRGQEVRRTTTAHRIMYSHLIIGLSLISVQVCLVSVHLGMRVLTPSDASSFLCALSPLPRPGRSTPRVTARRRMGPCPACCSRKRPSCARPSTGPSPKRSTPTRPSTASPVRFELLYNQSHAIPFSSQIEGRCRRFAREVNAYTAKHGKPSTYMYTYYIRRPNIRRNYIDMSTCRQSPYVTCTLYYIYIK